MKFFIHSAPPPICSSHPTRGGWIEIGLIGSKGAGIGSPTPHGVGGLKWVICFFVEHDWMSHPTRGGWIEMSANLPMLPIQIGPTPHGVGGLKFPCISLMSIRLVVPPHTGWVD